MTVCALCSNPTYCEMAGSCQHPGVTKSRDPEQPRYGAVNASRKDHIARLRARIKNLHSMTAKQELRGVLMGILDLLEDDGQ